MHVFLPIFYFPKGHQKKNKQNPFSMSLQTVFTPTGELGLYSNYCMDSTIDELADALIVKTVVQKEDSDNLAEGRE